MRFYSWVLGFPAYMGRILGTPPEQTGSWSHCHQWPHQQSVGSSCRRWATAPKVRPVSPLQVKASHPWCYYPLTHAPLCRQECTGAHAVMASTTFPGLTAWLGLFLSESRTVWLRKVQLPQRRRSGTLPPLNLCQPPTSIPSAFPPPPGSLCKE